MHQPADELQVALLGPLVVTRGRPVRIASRPQRRLVAALAVHAGEVVRASSLEEWLRVSPGAIRTSVSRLRRLVGADAVETTPVGYRLRAQVDAATFERLVSLAPDLGDDAARSALESAIGLWRDDPLAEFAGEAWAEPTVRRLSELHATAVEDLAVLQLDAGHVSTALVAIGALVDREPFRERSQALLMRALADGGRPTEALRTFHTFRQLLCDEVGIEPSSALVDLDRAIAASIETSSALRPRPGDPAWGRARHSPAPVAAHHAPPTPLSSFVGRRDDLATVLDLIGEHRLVTLTGSGGCGKTRLAIAAAAAETDRSGTVVRWVELGLASTADAVNDHVAAACGITTRSRGDPTEHLIDHLATEPPVLLVLDNAEHVLTAVAVLVAPLLRRCRHLRVLVTSREPLGITGESVWRVPSLATPPPHFAVGVDEVASFDALALFVERARQARTGFVLDDESIAHVAAICRGVDGLPFAVELAAARTRTMPVEVVSAGIGDAVRWQATASAAPLGRHATLHASIAWSVDLVDPPARTVLARLAVFQGSFTLEAALSVGGDGEPVDRVADAVTALVDASLLQFDDVTGRFRMLQTVRRFCTLRSHGEVDRARARHAHHLAAFCADVGAGRRGIARGQFIREMPDLVAAMDWAREHEPRLVFAMCAGLAAVRSALGHDANVADTWAWLLSLERGSDTTADWSSEWATAVAALMASATGHASDVSAVIDEVDGLLPVDAVRARGWLTRGAAMVPAYRGRLAPILAHVAEVRGRHDDLEDSIYGGFAAYMLALVGRLDEADRHVAELERLTRRHRTDFRVDTVGNGYAAAVVADLARGELRAAAARARQPVPHDPAFSMTAAAALAHVALVTGDRGTFASALAWSRQRTIPVLRFLPTFIELVSRRLGGEVDHVADLAEQYWQEAAPVPVSQVHPLPVLTRALLDAGRVATATAMVDEAAGLVDAMEPAPLLETGVVASRAAIDVSRRDVDAAAVSVVVLLDLAVAHGFVPMTIDAVELVAAIADDPALTACLHAAVDGERDRIGARRSRPGGSTVPDGAQFPFDRAAALAGEWLTQFGRPAVVLPDAQL